MVSNGRLKNKLHQPVSINATIDYCPLVAQILLGGCAMNLRLNTRSLVFALFSCLTYCNGIALGQMMPTGVVTDLAIQGPGWFVIKEPTTGEFFATRNGWFQIDSEGYLVSCLGLRVQGYTNAALSLIGDLKLESPSSEFSIKSFDIASDGKFTLLLTDNSTPLAGQVLLQNFSAPSRLKREGHNLYSWSEVAGPLAQPGLPGTNGLGSLLSGWLEITPEPVRLSLFPSAATSGALTEGVLTPSPVQTDFGIRGSGFFLVRDPDSSERYATRAGLFLLDADNYLITYDRLRVQGYTNLDLSQIGDIKIDSTQKPAISTGTSVNGFTLGPDGKLTVTLDDWTSYTRAQVLLANFTHPELLVATNHGLYAGVDLAEPHFITTTGLRQVALELINVPQDLLELRRSLSFFHQGINVSDAIATHVALNGPGFFLLRNAVDNSFCVTRAGDFAFDQSGFLVNSSQLRVQGYNTTNLDTIGDLQVDLTGSPPTLLEVSIDSDGKLRQLQPGGIELVRGQILLQDFREFFLLRKKDATLYTNLQAAVPLPQPLPPQTAGLGDVIAGRLEVLDPMPELVPPSRDGVRLQITGEPLQQWTIQATADLSHWDVIGTITNGRDEVEFTDTSSSNYSHRFYRVVVSAP